MWQFFWLYDDDLNRVGEVEDILFLREGEMMVLFTIFKGCKIIKIEAPWLKVKLGQFCHKSLIK